MAKDKNQTPAEQPVAAPAATPEVQEQAQTPAEQKGADAEEETAQETAPQPHAEKIARCREALRSFPTLPEGYVCAKGIFFDKKIAEQMLGVGEELIIVTRENK